MPRRGDGAPMAQIELVPVTRFAPFQLHAAFAAHTRLSRHALRRLGCPSPSRTRGRPTVQGDARIALGAVPSAIQSASPPRSDRRGRACRCPGRLVRHVVDHHRRRSAARAAAAGCRDDIWLVDVAECTLPASMRGARRFDAGTATQCGARCAVQSPGRAAALDVDAIRSTSRAMRRARRRCSVGTTSPSWSPAHRASTSTRAHGLRRRLAAGRRQPAALRDLRRCLLEADGARHRRQSAVGRQRPLDRRTTSPPRSPARIVARPGRMPQPSGLTLHRIEY